MNGNEKLEAVIGKIRGLPDRLGDKVSISCIGDAVEVPGDIITVDELQAGLQFGGRVLPDEWYIKIPRVLADYGVRQLNLMSQGWWIGEGERKAGWITHIKDHIACHHPSPLTGSPEAMRGDAFIDMKGAYIEPPEDGVDRVILWHTKSEEGIGDEEKEIARSAGCSVASPYVAPWVIGARASGMRIYVAVMIF